MLKCKIWLGTVPIPNTCVTTIKGKLWVQRSHHAVTFQTAAAREVFPTKTAAEELAFQRASKHGSVIPSKDQMKIWAKSAKYEGQCCAVWKCAQWSFDGSYSFLHLPVCIMTGRVYKWIAFFLLGFVGLVKQYFHFYFFYILEIP